MVGYRPKADIQQIRRYLDRMPKKTHFIFLLILSVWTSPLPAASFDCKKAHTYVEKTICKDDQKFNYGLSKLDRHMNAAYHMLLLRSDHPEMIRVEQRRWLKERNTCKSYDCIKKAYLDRLRTMHKPVRLPATIMPSKGRTLESHLFPSEAKKMEVLINYVKGHSIEVMASDRDGYCENLGKELRDGKLTAVEPDIRAETEYDPRLEKWHRCDNEDVSDHPELFDNGFYDGFSRLGQPPYRYYRLELDGNKADGLEDVLYHEMGPTYYNANANVGQTGYSWVNLKKCQFQNSAPESQLYMMRKQLKEYYRFSLIANKDKEYLALSFFTYSKTDKKPEYLISMNKLNRNGKGLSACLWKVK